MFTDGVSDNLFDSKNFSVKFEELMEEVTELCVLPYLDGTTLTDTQACAACIADLAYSVYRYPRKSPNPYKYPKPEVEEEEEEESSGGIWSEL